jgi:hypothetical protein
MPSAATRSFIVPPGGNAAAHPSARYQQNLEPSQPLMANRNASVAVDHDKESFGFA